MSETLPTQRKPDAAPAITSIEIRVYFEDTDVTGRIYHASYLRFLERGRTEWLRRLGFRHSEIAGSSSVFFVVRKLQIDYLAPGLMDDLLRVETQVSAVSGASIEFFQSICRDQKRVASAKVLVATLRDGRAARVPEDIRRLALQTVSGSR